LIVLDTHAWLWWGAEPTLLSRTALDTIDAADTIGIAAISCWEVAMLANKGRIEIDRSALSWIQEALFADRVLLLDLTPHIAVMAAELQWDNGDPADRIIIATSIVHDASLVTKDRRIRTFPGVQTIW
jgi:PIN domain nuclease of toxin-antitoxin system